MGCSNSKTITTELANDNQLGKPTPEETLNNQDPKNEYRESEAFSIPFNCNNINGKKMLKEPPKRIKELMKLSEKLLTPTTLESLQDKQQRAEDRRQEILNKKVDNIQKNIQMLLHNEHRSESPNTESV